MNSFGKFLMKPACGSQASKNNGLGVCFSCEAPLADGWGLRIGFSEKFRESSEKEWPQVKLYFEGSGSVSLAKKLPNQQKPVLTRMLAAGLQGYEEVIRDNLR